MGVWFPRRLPGQPKPTRPKPPPKPVPKPRPKDLGPLAFALGLLRDAAVAVGALALLLVLPWP